MQSKRKYQPSNFKIVPPRPEVEIHLPDEQVICGPRGAAVGDFLNLLSETTPAPIVGAVVNGELRELTFPILMDSKVRPVTMAESDGMLIYRRSLTFLLDAAFDELYPENDLTIDHSVAFGGYYCQVDNKLFHTDEELRKLEATMRRMVEEDHPFVKREAPIEEAMAYFEAKNQMDKVRLLRHRRKDYLVLYRLGDHQDYHHGYMVPSTGYLKWFALSRANGGFTLRFPRRQSPMQVLPLPEYPKLLHAFRMYGDWLNRLEIDNVGALNDAIQYGRIREVILTSEAFHEQHVSEIATLISQRAGQLRIVLVSGPSSSGKTTFSKRLAVQLLSQGITPFPLEIDNYFVNRSLTPLDENGQLDFESLYALDLKHLSKDLQLLAAGKRVRLPKYNFLSGTSEPGEEVQIKPDQIIILEGIHGLNPNLTPEIPSETTFRIYTSALTQLNLDRHNRISTTDTRLARRIVRDARERGYNARDTIQRWESVRRGEKRNIFPYQENADVMFNSALVYELAALKPVAEPLLRQVPYGTAEYIEAKRMLALLEWFLPVEDELIPDNSILREFIGSSILEDFKLWHNH